MSQAHSISTRRRFGMSRVCRIWGAPRATVYRHRGPAAGAGAANAPRPPRRRGPRGACNDAELLLHIQAVIAASPFSGEGYRKIWARPRAQGVRTAPRRVRLGILMRSLEKTNTVTSSTCRNHGFEFGVRLASMMCACMICGILMPASP